MLWMITCRARADATALRTAALPAHRLYLDDKAAQILLAGGLLSDDGSQPLGATFIVKAADRAEAEAFIAEEPLNKAGVFDSVSVCRLFKGRLNPLVADAA